MIQEAITKSKLAAPNMVSAFCEECIIYPGSAFVLFYE